MDRSNRISLEQRFYEAIGIRLLKRGLLTWERSRRDGRRNDNYHPAAVTPLGIREFFVYLRYNAWLHIISTLGLGLYLLFYGRASVFWNVAAVAMVVMNLYCIGLQRYNYLTLRALEAKLLHRRRGKLLEALPSFAPCMQGYALCHLPGDTAFLRQLAAAMEAGTVFLIGPEQQERLNRLAGVFRRYNGKRPGRQLTRRSPEPYGRHQARILRFTRRWRRPPPFSTGAIVTQNPALEASFREIFPVEKSGDMLLRIGLWELAAEEMGEGL